MRIEGSGFARTLVGVRPPLKALPEKDYRRFRFAPSVWSAFAWFGACRVFWSPPLAGSVMVLPLCAEPSDPLGSVAERWGAVAFWSLSRL
jgi:hypothetical protein